MNGTALTSANQAAANQSVSQTVSLPLNITSANLAPTLRCVLRFYLGDTRAGSPGPLQSASGLNEGGGVTAQVPAAYDWSFALPQFKLVSLPSSFIQLNCLPVDLVYCPPGSQSSEAFQYATSSQVAVTFSVTGDTAYSISNSVGGKIQFQQNSDESFGGDFFGLNLSLDLTQSTTDTDSWDTTTTTSTDTSVESDNTLTISQSTSQQITQSNTSPPGETASWEQEPFWNDTFELMVNPQFAVWDYPTLQLMQLLSCWLGYTQVSIAQLYAVASGTVSSLPLTNTSSTASPTVELLQAECSNLIALDPFCAALWQGASLSNNPRFVPLGPQQFGMKIGPSSANPAIPLSNSTKIQLQTIDTYDYNNVTTTTVKYSAQVQSQFSMEQDQSSGVKYGLSYKSGGSGGSGGSGSSNSVSGGVSGGGSVTNSSTSSTQTTSTLTATYQNKVGTDYKTTTTVTGTLFDQPLQTSVKGPSQSGQDVLQVASTTGFTPGQKVVIDYGQQTQEIATVASIQDGVSLTMSLPLGSSHYPGETVQPFWSQMIVNAYRDLIYGGIAFQDANAQRPPSIPIIKTGSTLTVVDRWPLRYPQILHAPALPLAKPK